MGLFKHAKQYHFSTELCGFERFESREKQFLFDMVKVGCECADTVASLTALQRTGSAVAPGAYIDSDFFVAACFTDMLAGVRPQTTRLEAGDGNLHLFHAARGGNFAKGPRDQIEQWWKGADEIVQRAWLEHQFATKAKQLIREAHEVTEQLKALEFTYDLGHDCEYIGVQDHHKK